MFSMDVGLVGIDINNTVVTFINIISQHLSVKHTLQQMADYDYGSMHKMLLSTSALHSLLLSRPRAECGKLHNSCGNMV